MRFRQFLLVSSAILLGCTLFFAFLLSLLAYSHDRWLPSVINHYIFSEPLAGLPADSLRLELLQLKSWQRLKKLSLSGPENSALVIEGVSWPVSGELIIDRVDIRLPDQLPRALTLPDTALAETESVPAEDKSSPKASITSRDQPVSVSERPSSMGWLRQELSLRSEYEQYYRQLKAVVTKLDALRQQYPLHTLTVRSLSLQGVPLDSVIRLQYFKGDSGVKAEDDHWQFSLIARDLAQTQAGIAEPFVFDLKAELSDSRQTFDVVLREAERFNSDHLDLPAWLPLKDGLLKAQEYLANHPVAISESDIRLAIQLKASRADLAISIPSVVFHGDELCSIPLDSRTVSLSYLAGQPERLTLSLGGTEDHLVSGTCLKEHLAGVDLSELLVWSKGLSPASLEQGGRIRLELAAPIELNLTEKMINWAEFSGSWQPHDRQAPALQFHLKGVKLTPDTLDFTLQNSFSAELKPQAFFANQSRRLEVSSQIAVALAVDSPSVFADLQQGFPLIKHAQVDILSSDTVLKPVPNDEATLWAPAGFELPVFRHKGEGVFALENQADSASRWSLIHHGEGETLIRHPELKQNISLPYSSDLDVTAPLSILTAEDLISQIEGALRVSLVERPSLADVSADAPNALLPELSLDFDLNPDALQLHAETQLELSRIGEWFKLPSQTQITGGQLDLTGRFDISRAHLAKLSEDPVLASENLTAGLGGDFSIGLSRLGGKADGYEFNQIKLPLQGVLTSGQWHTEQTTLKAGRIYAGVELTDLAVDLNLSGDLNNKVSSVKARFTGLSAKALGGSVLLDRMNYPFSSGGTSDSGGETSELTLDKLDLSEMIALGDRQIKVTGRLNGTLPLRLSDTGIAIRQGRVYSSEGEIVLRENSAWQAMLQQQATLASQLRHLNNLHYDLMQGDIEMNEDGQLTAVLTIRGENKAESQPVNLNFTSEQNILTLLKALRLSDQIDKSLSESAQGMYQ
ncbi:intermembrane phospholipid transport protein YdbH family protein [Oceanospirillum sp.]|uniref:intermembrane phospholipid transport protein YdbH family protein n=1 Tax=Oceanospirillum sp. TaxID=2021254 RepID=UPI003A950CED